MNTLVAPDDTWTLWAIILAGVAASIYFEQTYRWAAKIGGPVLALLMAMLLSNLRIVPAAAPAYDVVWTYLVPTALPLLLFRANVLDIVAKTGWMFVAFHISTLGTILGAFLAVLLLHTRLPSSPQLAGIMSASYVGGAVNFFAVKDSLQVSENLTNPLLVADNFIMAGAFMALLLMGGSKFFRRHFPHPHSRDTTASPAEVAAEHWKAKEISLLDIGAALGTSVVIVAISQKLSLLIKQAIPNELIAAIVANIYVLITLISVTLATLGGRWLQRIRGSHELGSYLLYIFLFAIGLPADLRQVIQNVPIMFLFCFIMAATNIVFTLGVGKLCRLNLEDLLLSSNATLGGAPSAAAMAISMGWSELVLPGILVGIWGYTIGTFIGLAVAEFLVQMFPWLSA